MKIIKTLFLFLLLFVFFTSKGFTQNWDFEKYPRMDVELRHLDAEITIRDDLGIEGDLLYTIGFRANHIDSLILDAVQMDIAGISVDNSSIDYSVEKDRIILFFSEEHYKGDVADLRIQYRTRPKFGVHQNLYGTTWTSLLPRSVRHWLPVYDHPRARFTTDLVFTHPSGTTIVSNGRKSGTEVKSVEEEITTFSSNRSIPASTLSWAMGDLQRITGTHEIGPSTGGLGGAEDLFRRSTDPQIYIYSESDTIDDEPLLNTAVTAFRDVQEETGVKYPFRDLHILVLHGSHWETKSYGSGIIYIYLDRGSVEEQMRRGILSQWVGVTVIEEQWSDAGGVLALKALLAETMFDFDREEGEQPSPEPYHVFSVSELGKWQQYLSDTNNTAFREQLMVIAGDIFDNGTALLGWDELAERIYHESGQPYFTKPDLRDSAPEPVQQIEYRVESEWDEASNTIQLNFTAIDGGASELVTIQSEEITVTGVKINEFTITGETESIVLNVDSGIENLKLHVTERDDIMLREEKPFMFWIHQLRNDEDVERRREAARSLALFDDNPDLQLALTDLLQLETNPEVYSEILRSLAKITTGASGTDQIFLDHVSNDQPEEVRLAAVEAFAFYTGSDRVIQRLRRIINDGSTSSEIRRTAIRSLFEITGAEPFKNITESDVTNEAVLPDVPLFLELLAQKGEIETTVRLSETFLDRGFPYQVRKGALDLLLQYDEGGENWETRLNNLLTDNDPRIRYFSIDGLRYIDAEKRNELLEYRLVQEYDERVRRRLLAE